MNSATQLKALIRNISKDKKVNAQILLRNYMLERLLERISISQYKHNFILKGGMLIAAMVGIDTRSTMDMDATIKGVPVSKENIKIMFDEILAVNVNDNVDFTINSIDDIRDEADYTGFRVSLNTIFDGIKQTLKIDITTGDTITPREIVYKFNLMLENRTIEVMAYNLETVLAEKLETIISRGTTNTRMRDFYDVYILTKLQADNINQKLLDEALNRTAINRGTDPLLDNKGLIVSEIITSSIMQDLWIRYQKKYDYADDISWGDVMGAVQATLNISDRR
ncbi:MAG TPA: nucleotidyl transferase AbiEii/AbiGii toxin family protein [Ruminiclostridium sp.]